MTGHHEQKGHVDTYPRKIDTLADLPATEDET